jgi:hypothetical protein
MLKDEKITIKSGSTMDKILNDLKRKGLLNDKQV